MIKDIPIMLFDGDCGFCRRWIEKWRKATAPRVAYEPYQKELMNYPQLSEAQCREAVQLIMPDGTVLSGAKAVLKALQIGGKDEGLFWSYEHVPLFAPAAEWCYRLVAHNRTFFSNLLPPKS